MNPSKEDLELRRDFDGDEFEKTELFFLFGFRPCSELV